MPSGLFLSLVILGCSTTGQWAKEKKGGENDQGSNPSPPLVYKSPLTKRRGGFKHSHSNDIQFEIITPKYRLTMAKKEKAKVRFRSPYDREIADDWYEKGGGEKMTIPGEALTVRELLLKHTQGVLDPIQKTPYYSGTEDFDDVDPTTDPAFDLTDATEIKQDLDEKIQARKAKEAGEEKTKGAERAKTEEKAKEAKDVMDPKKGSSEADESDGSKSDKE